VKRRTKILNWKFRNLSFPLLLAFTLLALRKEIQHARQAEKFFAERKKKIFSVLF
jgi:hypothetical protein